MLDYNTAEYLTREFWDSIIWDDSARYFGGRYSMSPVPPTLMEDVTNRVYDLMTEMFCRQHHISYDLSDYAEQYVKSLVKYDDATTILLACLLGDEPFMVYPKMFDKTTYEQAWESGVAELLDSYMSGIPLEQVIG